MKSIAILVSLIWIAIFCSVLVVWYLLPYTVDFYIVAFPDGSNIPIRLP